MFFLKAVGQNVPVHWGSGEAVQQQDYMLRLLFGNSNLFAYTPGSGWVCFSEENLLDVRVTTQRPKRKAGREQDGGGIAEEESENNVNDKKIMQRFYTQVKQ